MIFVFKKWDIFCKKLQQKGIKSIPAFEVSNSQECFFVLKHDVETKVSRAYKMAKIEHKYGHRGSYYIQAYLLSSAKNIELLNQIKEMGHEVSYHYDVMDSNQGDIEKAISEFENKKTNFEVKGFPIMTVCQHGNPVANRIGYTSNRDFFRNKKVQSLYPHISDIMVDYAQKRDIEYTYYSDAGRKFKMIFDPLTNDIVNSENKNIDYKNLDVLFSSLTLDKGNIISTHPHRWTNFCIVYLFQSGIFKLAKFIAKMLIKFPCFKSLFEKHYSIAKKF